MMNWGKWIVVAFVFFALFIGVLVTVSMRQDVDLVAKDYYQQELGYQDQIDRINNTNALSQKPTIAIQNGEYLNVFFMDMEVEQGTVHLFRPSNSRMDQKFVLRSSADSVQQFKLQALEKGMYKVKLEWTMRGKEYFMEEIISI